MKVAMTMNEKDFARVLELVFARSSRTFPQFLNGQALRMASFAVESTEKADPNKIAWALGQVNRVFSNKKTGKALKTPRRVYSSAKSLSLYKIVNWRRARVGLPGLGGKAMSKPARKLRAAALRSTSFIASGWIYAVRGLSRLVGYEGVARPKSARMTGSEKGWVQPATFTLSGIVSCIIGNSALLAQSAQRTGARDGRPMRIAQHGLGIARDRTAKDMLAHLARKVQPILTQHSATR